MKKRTRVVLGAAAIGAAAAVAAVATGIGFGGSPTPALSDGIVTALDRPARSGDALPDRVLELPFARHFAPSTARLAFRDAERSVYVVAGRDSSLCLVVVETTNGVGLNCAGRSVLRGGAVWQGTGNDDGSTDIVGVVGDGVAYARTDGNSSVTVKDNFFRINAATGRTIIFGKRDGAEASFDLGDMSRPQ
jgi:hypothetical protein